MTGAIVFGLLLVPGAPAPPGASGGQVGPTSAKVDPIPLNQFVSLVETLANTVRDNSSRDSVTQKDLYAGAIRGLYDEVGQPVPEKIQAAIRAAKTQADRLEVLREARTRLGDHPNLAGTRSLFAAMNGFRHATDPICCLATPRPNDYASIEQDFGVGIELDGVTGTHWAIYQVEYRIATGAMVPVGYFGRLPKPDAVPCPAVFPWRVQRVIPGSPAQKAGVKPGDRITRLDGIEITAHNMNANFAKFALPRRRFDPRTGQPEPQEWSLSFRRGDEETFDAKLKVGPYRPESAFGVWKRDDRKWDCLLDRQNKIGYIRLGSIELGLDTIFADMMAELAKQGCRGLILDLRWCPGGYVDPGEHIAGQFLPNGCVISKREFFHPERTGQNGDILAPPGGGKYAKFPLVVIVGHETIGGGELIASALRDNNRCVVIGQRTAGRASIQNAAPAGFGGLDFRIPVGVSLRPNGKNRQRLPQSQPTDDWGIRPDEGWDVPATADKSAELHRQADLHALRAAGSREALPFDDPAQDPFRLAALKYLRTKLTPTK